MESVARVIWARMTSASFKMKTVKDFKTFMGTEDSHALVGIDTGGTFTDFVWLDRSEFRVHKVLSTPKAPEKAILKGMRALGIEQLELSVVHGSTVATNAVLEGKGVRTAFIANRGFADLLAIGRQNRERLYDLQPPVPPPPVPRELCLETGGRLDARGSQVEALSDSDLDELRRRLADLAPRSVAVCLLFSFRKPELERRIAACAPEGCQVSCSSDVLPEVGEYERGIATWLNAYVGPLMSGYLERMARSLPRARVSVMQSEGRTVAADQAGERGVHLLLSGPAGGLAGAEFIGRQSGEQKLMTLDMGGTSTDVALIDGVIRRTTEGRIGRYPVAVPMVDMHTIGAGGGSIARVDAGGLLNVGPESAGADPGPVCYGRGGERPTVTDANLALGRLPRDTALGGTMRLDAEAARAAMARLAAEMATDETGAARGVVDLANEHMSRALRVISVEKGHDPRDFVLMSFGGAGGLHVCELAQSLGMRRALVPPHAGVLSALGMLVAPPGRELAAAMPALLDELGDEELEKGFERLAARARRELEAEGQDPNKLQVERSLDLRYRGQGFTLGLPWRGLKKAASSFHEAHRDRFGHDLDADVEVVNIRVAVTGRAPDVRLPEIPEKRGSRPTGESRLADLDCRAEVWRREDLGRGHRIEGPAVIAEAVGTTYLPPDWTCRMTRHGVLVLER